MRLHGVIVFILLLEAGLVRGPISLSWMRGFPGRGQIPEGRIVAERSRIQLVFQCRCSVAISHTMGYDETSIECGTFVSSFFVTFL
jgi:hypothetical protein